MNKKIAIGIIIAVAIIIGISASMLAVSNVKNDDEITTPKSTPPEGKKFTLELSEKVGITEHP